MNANDFLLSARLNRSAQELSKLDSRTASLLSALDSLDYLSVAGTITGKEDVDIACKHCTLLIKTREVRMFTEILNNVKDSFADEAFVDFDMVLTWDNDILFAQDDLPFGLLSFGFSMHCDLDAVEEVVALLIAECRAQGDLIRQIEEADV